MVCSARIRLAQNRCSVSVCGMNGLKEVLRNNPMTMVNNVSQIHALPSLLSPCSSYWLYRPSMAGRVSGVSSPLMCLKLEGIFLEALVSFIKKKISPRNLPADFPGSGKAEIKYPVERNGKAKIGLDQRYSFLWVWHSAAPNKIRVLSEWVSQLQH